MVLFGKKLSTAAVKRYFPDQHLRSSNGPPKKSGFYASWAPWLLGDRRSVVYYTKDLPVFVTKFCKRHGIPMHQLRAVRPDIPEKELINLPRVPADKSGKRSAPDAFDARSVPDWYRAYPSPETKAELAQNLPLYLYVPWIAEHGDTLISRIASPEYALAPFDMMKGVDDNSVRRKILDFARKNPDLYRRMVLRRLIPLRARISGFILTFDWAPVMRIIAGVCQELGIPTILVPHESVFIDKSKYYWDMTSLASVPVCDVILGWGQLQREIFSERGYPDHRFLAVGAPKFDAYHAYEPKLTRAEAHRLFGLSPDRKTILFASQPLDSQLDHRSARQSQRQAIEELLTYAETQGANLIVRLPPSKDDILGATLRKRLLTSEFGAYDDATCYLVNPEEALYHCDVVTSINSTMLFEGMLLGRPALSMKYVDFEDFWTAAGVPAAQSIEEATPLLDAMLAGDWTPDSQGVAWAAHTFGVGEFDGRAAERIRAYLIGVATGAISISPREALLDRLKTGAKLDVVAIASSKSVLTGLQQHLPRLINARSVVSSNSASLDSLASVDLFLQWGITLTGYKEKQRLLARILGKPVVIVEDGFIRSIDIGLSGAPGLSIIIDEVTAYYDATKQSQLEKTLQDGRELSAAETLRARAAIDKIVANQVTKYNHAPRRPVEVGRPGSPKVLVVDQRAGDQSIASGLGSDESFMQMLADAITENPQSDVIIKRHPDAMSGGKVGYFGNELDYVDPEHRHRVFLFDEEINPYSLMNIVDAVYVVTSGLGFEALMAGRRVHCYGAPFYSGWGCTQDKIKLERRNRSRTVEEIFHFAYIEASRYVNPDSDQLIEVEEIVDWIVANRDRRTETAPVDPNETDAATA